MARSPKRGRARTFLGVGTITGVVVTDPAGNATTIPYGELLALLGGGDVSGPGASTDNAIARFDGTTGKLLQNSAPLVEDDGRISTLTDPTLAQDAATKAYVDGLVAGGGGAQWSVLTNGDVSAPELIYALGDVIMLETP